MAWLIGLISVVIVLIFWRIFLPLGVVAAAALIAIFGYSHFKQEADKKRAF